MKIVQCVSRMMENVVNCEHLCHVNCEHLCYVSFYGFFCIHPQVISMFKDLLFLHWPYHCLLSSVCLCSTFCVELSVVCRIIRV